MSEIQPSRDTQMMMKSEESKNKCMHS